MNINYFLGAIAYKMNNIEKLKADNEMQSETEKNNNVIFDDVTETEKSVDINEKEEYKNNIGNNKNKVTDTDIKKMILSGDIVDLIDSELGEISLLRERGR